MYLNTLEKNEMYKSVSEIVGTDIEVVKKFIKENADNIVDCNYDENGIEESISTMNKNIRIDDKGHTIDAKNFGRIFSIGEGFAVTLTNVTLTNGNATVGVAIYNFGNLDLVYVNFVNNTAKYGGAIMNYAYGLVLDDSTFTNNTAKIDGVFFKYAD